MHALNQFKKAGGAYVTRDELEAALAPIRAALELGIEVEITEEILEVSGEPTSRPAPASAAESLESADSTKTGLSGSDKKRSRKSAHVDPLGLVPEGDED